jgi:hypothetical protein
MAGTSWPILSAPPRRSGPRHLGALLLVAFALIAIVAPTAAVRGTDLEHAGTLKAEVSIYKFLDRDRDLATDADLTLGGAGWEFTIGVNGSGEPPVQVSTVEEGWVTHDIEVPGQYADLRITETSEEADLLGVYTYDRRGERYRLSVQDQGVTVSIHDSEPTWPLEFVNAGPIVTVDARVETWIDVDGDPDTDDDRESAAGWVYDLEVSGTATTNVSAVETGDGDESGRFVIEMTEASTTLHVTQQARDGYSLLDAYATDPDGMEVGTRDDLALTVEVDRDMGKLRITFVNRSTIPAPTATPTATPTPTVTAAPTSTPTGEVHGATGTPAVTLPPTDVMPGTPQPVTPASALVIVALTGLVIITLSTVRSRRQAR